MVFDPSKFVMEVEKKESEFGRVKPGNYASKVIHVIDLGTKIKEGVDNKTKEEYSYETKQIFINFAMNAKVLVGDDAKESEEKKEVVIGKCYTLSLANNAHLFKDVKSGFGFEPKDKFNPFTLIGKDVMVNVGEHVSGDNTYGVINSLSQIPEGLPLYELQELELDGSILEEGLYNAELEKYLFGFAKKDLESSKEYIALTGKVPDKTLEEEDKEIEKEIAKAKESTKPVKEVSAKEAGEIFKGVDKADLPPADLPPAV